MGVVAGMLPGVVAGMLPAFAATVQCMSQLVFAATVHATVGFCGFSCRLLWVFAYFFKECCRSMLAEVKVCTSELRDGGWQRCV